MHNYSENMQRTLFNFLSKSSYDVTKENVPSDKTCQKKKNLSEKDSVSQKQKINVPSDKTCQKKTNLSDKDSVSQKQKNQPKLVQDRWFKIYPWFETNDERNKLFCQTCKSANLNNKLATEGASNCQLSTLYKHTESREHKTAESIIKLRANKATQLITGVEDDDSTDDEVNHDDIKNESGTVKLFRTVHKAAKCHLPNDCVNDLLDLQRENGIYIPFRDLSSTSVSQDFALGAIHVVHVVKDGDNVTLSCDSSATEYPIWVGPNTTVYNVPGNARILDTIGEKSYRLSWDPVNNKSLIVHDVTKSDSGVYMCYGEYDIEKYDVYVIVKPKKPEISNKEILDDGTEVIRGKIRQLFKLTCTSTGGFPKPNLEWFRDNNQTQSLNSNETYEKDADDNYIVEQTYTFTPTRKDDGALYLCQSSFDFPQQFYQIDEVKLFVNLRLKNPEICNKEILDGGTEVIRGTMEQLFKLTCTATGGFSKPNLEWFRDNNQTRSLNSSETYEIDADGNYIVKQTYTFTPTRQDDGALYLCHSSFNSPQQFYQTDEVKLFLNLKPMSLSITTHVVVEGISGEAVVCSASQYRPNTAVLWLQIDDNNITSVPDITLTNNVTTQTFTIVAMFKLILNRDNNGQRVSCLIAHDTLHTPQIATGTIQVYYAPDVTVTTTNVTVLGTAVLTCNPSGLPAVYTYSDWTHSWPGHGTVTHTETLGNNQTLRITSLTYEHSGVYHCSASNGVIGSLNSNAGHGSTFLQVRTFPIILTSSPIQAFAEIQTDTSASITFYSNRRNNMVECSRNSTRIYCGWFLEDVDISLPVIDSIVQTKGWTAKVILSIQDNDDLGTFTVTIRNDVGASTIDVNVLNSEQTSNVALLLGVVGGVVAVIVWTIMVVVVVRKRRSNEYTRGNTSLYRNTIQAPETANPTSAIEMEPIHCENYNIDSLVYEELEELKENAREYGNVLTGSAAMIPNDNMYENPETKE